MSEAVITDYEQACAEYDKGNYIVAYEKFYTLAVEHDVSCQMNVANMLLHGVGTAENPEKAYEWYKQAAYNDDKEAQYIYGWHCIEKGDEAEGMRYIVLSSDAGYADAAYDLAGCYVQGSHSCEVDMSKAAVLYEKAALLGKKEALNGLFYTKSNQFGKVRTILYFLKNILSYAKAVN